MIKDFYAKLATLDELLASTLAPFQAAGEKSLSEKVHLLAKHFNETRDNLISRKVFFSSDVCALAEQVLELARGIFFDVTTYQIDPAHSEYKYNRQVLGEQHEFWEKARAAHKNEFSLLKGQLEAEFREMLGIAN